MPPRLPTGRSGPVREADDVTSGRQHGPGDGHWPLIGRDDELASLDAVAGHVVTGRPRVVLLEGPAGIGKSALVSAWCRTDDRFLALRARCHPREEQTAFGVVRQLFQPVIASAGEEARKALLADEMSARQVPGTGPAPGGPDTMAALLTGLVQRPSAQQPLLLVIDDVQWIDPPSLAWLVRCLRYADTCPVLIVAVTPTADFRSPDPLLAELLHPSHCRTISLGPLGVLDVQRLAQAVWNGEHPDPSFCATCHATTNGHPLFLRAVLHHARLGGLRPTAEFQDRLRRVSPPTLRREIRHRLSQGAPEAVGLAQALALLGDGSPWHLLAAHCGRGEAVLRAAASDLRGLGLLRADTAPSFVHEAVRDTVLETMSAEELGQQQASAAHVSYLDGRSDEEVAAHLLAADPVQGTWAVPVLRRAADEALRRGAPDRAASSLRCALRQPPQAAEKGPVLLRLAVATSCCNAVQAASYATGALELLTDATGRREALSLLTSCLLLAPGSGVARSEVDRLLGEEHSRAEAQGADRELELRAGVLRSWAEYEWPTARTAAPTPPADLDHLLGRTPAERQLLALHAFSALRAGRPASSVRALLDRASGNLRVLSHETFPLHYFVAQSLLHLDELGTADRLRVQLTQGIAGTGKRLLEGSVAAFHAASALRRGDVTEALDTAQKALDLGRAAGRPPYATTLDAIRIDALLLQGRVDAAEHVAAGRPTEGPDQGAWETPLFLMSLAALRTAQGDIRTGLSLLHECGQHLDAAGTVSPAVSPWRSRAAAGHLALGETATAGELVEEELDLARRCEIPRAVGTALRMAGKVASGGQRIELLSEATSVLTATPARLELSCALHDLGGALLHRGDIAGARRTLRRGWTLAVGCGATALASRLRQRLRDAGGRAGKGSGLLTPGEERVSALAAQGHSNKEIAERLVVSLRAVESHLTGAYRKLGITGRYELAAALAASATAATGAG
ncbi:helix-turn-helix transcriptional regulator [Streptomyces sp. ID38640]|nr:helix-turn-helix transcriptional regulator [Streptomyces sp. ID38640]